MLALLGIYIKIDKMSAGKRSMWIHISWWQIVCLGTLTSLSIAGWHRRRSGQRWHHFWCRLSESVGQRGICYLVTPACLRIHCGAILTRKAFVSVVSTKCSWVSVYRSHHHSMPRKLNSPLLLFSDIGVRFLVQVLPFLYCGTQKLSFGHNGPIQGQGHVGLIQHLPELLALP